MAERDGRAAERLNLRLDRQIASPRHRRIAVPTEHVASRMPALAVDALAALILHSPSKITTCGSLADHPPPRPVVGNPPYRWPVGVQCQLITAHVGAQRARSRAARLEPIEHTGADIDAIRSAVGEDAPIVGV